MLEREGIDAVYGDYWVAYRLVFETEERVVAATSLGCAPLRPATSTTCGPAPARPGSSTRGDAARRAGGGRWTALDVEAEVIDAGAFAVVIPNARSTRSEVPDEARHPA